MAFESSPGVPMSWTRAKDVIRHHPFPRGIGHVQITQVSPQQQWQPQHTEQTQGKQWKLCNPHSLNAHSLPSCSYRSAWNIWVCPWEACPTARKNILSCTEKPCCWGVEQIFTRWKESALVFLCSAILVLFCWWEMIKALTVAKKMKLCFCWTL